MYGVYVGNAITAVENGIAYAPIINIFEEEKYVDTTEIWFEPIAA